MLLQENKLTMELTEKFWGLSKFDYKPEVYKIVTDGAALLKQEHIDYIFDQNQTDSFREAFIRGVLGVE